MKVSLKSDIWGLGIILYQIVYKNLPFASVPGGKTAKIKALTDPTRPVEFGEIADKQLLDTMKKCLEKDPSKRPTTGELLQHPYITGDSCSCNDNNIKDNNNKIKARKQLRPNREWVKNSHHGSYNNLDQMGKTPRRHDPLSSPMHMRVKKSTAFYI